MKKRVSIFLVALIICSICAVTPYAATQGRGRNFTDQNQDGVCDYCQSGDCMGKGSASGKRLSFVDADGDGICDHRQSGDCMGKGSASGRKLSFVDADGDGICDHREANKARPPRDGRGRNR